MKINLWFIFQMVLITKAKCTYVTRKNILRTQVQYFFWKLLQENACPNSYFWADTCTGLMAVNLTFNFYNEIFYLVEFGVVFKYENILFTAQSTPFLVFKKKCNSGLLNMHGNGYNMFRKEKNGIYMYLWCSPPCFQWRKIIFTSVYQEM